MISALWLAATAVAGVPSPAVYVDGACPGDVTISVYVTPGATASFLYSSELGELVMPFGACAGTTSGLGGTPGWALNVPDGDGDGVIVFEPYLPVGACGKHIQILELDSCTWSNVETVGSPYRDVYPSYGEDYSDYTSTYVYLDAVYEDAYPAYGSDYAGYSVDYYVYFGEEYATYAYLYDAYEAAYPVYGAEYSSYEPYGEGTRDDYDSYGYGYRDYLPFYESYGEDSLYGAYRYGYSAPDEYDYYRRYGERYDGYTPVYDAYGADTLYGAYRYDYPPDAYDYYSRYGTRYDTYDGFYDVYPDTSYGAYRYDYRGPYSYYSFDPDRYMPFYEMYPDSSYGASYVGYPLDEYDYYSRYGRRYDGYTVVYDYYGADALYGAYRYDYPPSIYDDYPSWGERYADYYPVSYDYERYDDRYASYEGFYVPYPDSSYGAYRYSYTSPVRDDYPRYTSSLRLRRRLHLLRVRYALRRVPVRLPCGALRELQPLR